MLRVLAIGPHPDDIEFGCGGTLAKLSQLGAKIYMLVMTKGEMGGDPSVRQAEAEKAADMIGAELIWGGYFDTMINFSRELIMSIERVLKLTRPQIIFVNFPEDTHQDHVAVARATITATRYSRNVLFYEVPSTAGSFTPNVFTDITDVLDMKLKLLQAHASQVDQVKIGNLNILEVAKSTANFRGIQARCEYAEAFQPYRFQLMEILFLVANGLNFKRK